MENSFRRQSSSEKQPNGFLTSLHFFDSILTWMAGLIQLTDEEEKDAGIYLGD